VKSGQAIFLEVKKPDGRQSPEQNAFGSDAIVAGARYHIVRSIDDVQKVGL
jgi:hypothetical protein